MHPMFIAAFSQMSEGKWAYTQRNTTQHKKNKIKKLIPTWMELKGIMSEISQGQKDNKYRTVSLSYAQKKEANVQAISISNKVQIVDFMSTKFRRLIKSTVRWTENNTMAQVEACQGWSSDLTIYTKTKTIN